MTTCESEEQAKKLARRLVERRLAACVNVIPKITSIYHWDGDICEESEVLLVIKSDEKNFYDLTESIKQLHSYDCPELIQIPITGGSEQYIEWLAQELK